MNIRCFDLGGSGLRTCSYISGNQALQGLGNLEVSEHDDIAKWIRKTLPTLEQEISEGFAFSFSLAGLDKLSKTGQLHTKYKRESVDIAKLFNLPRKRVFALNDGDAHLLASRTCLSITEFPQINFCVGTGVGIGMYDEIGRQVPEHELSNKLGKDVWDLAVADPSALKKEVWFALSALGYKELQEKDPANARNRFEDRWSTFLQDQIFKALQQMPKTITFSGGVVEFSDLFGSRRTLLDCQIRKGPKHAGLLGAKFHARSPDNLL